MTLNLILKKYKFSKGDKVIVTHGHGKYKTITGIIKNYSEDDDSWAVILNGLSYPINFAEEWIKPYTKPETKSMQLSDVKDKIDKYFDSHTDEEVLEALEHHGAIETKDPKYHKGQKVYVEEKVGTPLEIIKYVGNGKYIIGALPCEIEEELIIPYDETKDNMEEVKDYPPYLDRPKKIVPTQEEKELNLCELLKDCEGQTFYSDVFELVVLTKVNLVGNFLTINWNRLDLNLYSNGSKVKGNRCVLWPSKELYEKYPLDPYSAWMEWKEERTPKRWRAKYGEDYWWIDEVFVIHVSSDVRDDFDNPRYENGNYFRTEELARQAAEVVKEVIAKFHEKNGEE